jgi:hypothetical protein
MTLLYSMDALLGERFSLGPIPTGDERIVIPIVGGTFKGPRMNGALAAFTPTFPGMTSHPSDPSSPNLLTTFA